MSATAGTADESLLYDADGNLSESNATGLIAPGAGRRQAYVWDAENRLTAVQPVAAAASGDRKVEFAYDSQVNSGQPGFSWMHAMFLRISCGDCTTHSPQGQVICRMACGE